jgi:hypothetical protein
VGILKKFSMIECKSMVMDLKKMNDDDSYDIDPQLIGSLMYLVKTIHDSCYVVNVLSQSMNQLRQTHWTTAKHVLRYLRGTVRYGLRYAPSENLSLLGYAEWTKNTVDRKRKYDCCFTMKFSMVSWCNIKQRSMALSTTEDEYISLSVRSSATS